MRKSGRPIKKDGSCEPVINPPTVRTALLLAALTAALALTVRKDGYHSDRAGCLDPGAVLRRF
ncbi:hypothetical protein [Streptomyces sp. NPDC058622]|uniref:hypothetical protein n=1 Tax=Streptomyces sp. NPDC058622 TaxID=3346562 RepID=UPI00365254DE